MLTNFMISLYCFWMGCYYVWNLLIVVVGDCCSHMEMGAGSYSVITFYLYYCCFVYFH